MVKEITSADEFYSAIKVPNLVVVDFYATWCGPCKMIAPFIEQLANKYPEVVFLKVGEHNCQDLIMKLGVQAFPTFYFYVNGNKVDQMSGADARTLENKVNQHKVAGAFGGKGFTVGWDGVGMPPANPREARLRAFGNIDSKPSASNSEELAKSSSAQSISSPPTPMSVEGVEDEDEALAMAIALSKAESEMKVADSKPTSSGAGSSKPISVEAQDKLDQAEAEAQFAEEQAEAEEAHRNRYDGWEEEMVPVPVDEALLNELVEMGFPDVRARKGIVHGKDLEGALLWLTEHLEDPDIDQPYMVRKADTIPKRVLTAEERAAKIAQMKDKLKLRRAEKDREAKAEELRKEKERRERGQKMEGIQEERERMQRKRELEKAKREKDDAKRERERLREEVARDKELRKQHKGVLPSVLGVDGYNPSIIQYDKPSAEAASKPAGSSSATDSSSGGASKPAAAAKATAVDAEGALRTIDASISTIMRYRTGGDGGQALKLLITFVKNVVDNPDDPKFRSINTESKAFKSKFSNIVGPLPLLKALGFEKVESDSGEAKLQLNSVNAALFRSALNKLNDAEENYRKLNG